MCKTLNANSGKTVIVTLCIQIEWLFYNVFGVKLSHESGADSTGHGSTCPHVYKWLDWRTKKRESVQTALTITKALTKTTYCTCKAKSEGARPKKKSGALRLTCASIPLLNSFQRQWMSLRRHHRYHHRLVHKTVSKTFTQPDNGFITTGQAD